MLRFGRRLTAAALIVSVLLSGCAAENNQVSKETQETGIVVSQTGIKSGSQKTETNTREFVVVIDAGHQYRGNSRTEPIGPGSSQRKAKVSSGTSGCVSGLNEYQLNLQVSRRLQKKLKQRGYKVIMVRTKNKVNISNSERAKVANKAHADAFVRIHANSSANSSVHGAMTICQTSKNKYNGKLYKKSKSLAAKVLNELVKATGCAKQYVWKTDSMSGINWAKVPVTIVEMGYMSNAKEDRKMAKKTYQNKIAEGIANGIDLFLKKKK